MPKLKGHAAHPRNKAPTSTTSKREKAWSSEDQLGQRTFLDGMARLLCATPPTKAEATLRSSGKADISTAVFRMFGGNFLYLLILPAAAVTQPTTHGRK